MEYGIMTGFLTQPPEQPADGAMLMPDDARRRLEVEAALKQIKTIQRRQTGSGKRRWRLDVSLPVLAMQGLGVFIIGVLVGLGLYVLYNILFG